MNKQHNLNEQEVIEHYLITKSCTTTSQKFNVSPVTIQRILRKNKIDANGNKKKISEDILISCLNEYIGGKPIAKISQQYNVSDYILRKFFKSKNIDTNNRTPIEIQNNIVNLFVDGKTCKEIKNSLNLSMKVIQNTLIRNNLINPPKYDQITENQKELCIFDFKNGLTLKEICKKYLLPEISISKLLRESGINIQPNILSQEIVSKILQLYKDGKLITEICQELKVSYSTVTNHLKKNNIMINNHLYDINHDCFDTIDSELKAYTLFFFIGDGCVAKDDYRNELNITVKRSDEYIVKEMNKLFSKDNLVSQCFAKLNGNIFYKSALNVNSKNIKARLNELGIGPQKSLTVGLSKQLKQAIPNDLWGHAIRGLIDSDGHFGLCTKGNTPIISICGTKIFFEEMNKIIFEKFGFEFKLRQDRNIYLAYISKLDHIVQIINWIYQDATIFLTRKKILADAYINRLKDFNNREGIKTRERNRIAKNQPFVFDPNKESENLLYQDNSQPLILS